MTTRRLPKSMRKYVRREKARIRQETGDAAEAARRIRTLTADLRARLAPRTG